MRHLLSLLTTILAVAVLSVAVPDISQARPARENPATVRTEMQVLHDLYGVNFIYDSALNLDIPYRGKPMKDLAVRHSHLSVRHSRPDRESLEACLTALFKDTGIDFEIMKQYIVLTKADSRKKPKDYTIFIEEQRDTIDESRITAYIDRRRNATQTGLQKIDGSRFRKGFAAFSSPDLIKELQNLSGVSSGTEMFSGFYVHGGDGTDNLFLLDGVPLYQVSHLAGLISSFNTEIVDNLDFYKSGFPSRFGGKLSSVVDIATRTGDMHDYRGSFNIGLLNGAFQFEGPIVPGKTSFNFGLRRSWYDVLTAPVVAIANLTFPYGEKGRMRYAMTDLNTSVTHLFDKDNILSFNLYLGSDHIRYGYEQIAVRYWEGARYTGEFGHDLNVSWGNILGSIRWTRNFSDDLHMNSTLYYTRTNTDVGMTNDKWDMNEYQPVITEISLSENNDSRLHDVGAKADLDWMPSQYHHIRGGASFVWHFFRPVRDVSIATSVTGHDDTLEEDSFGVKYDMPEAALYAEDEIAFAGWLKANLGLRYVLFGTEGGLEQSLEPRAALRFQLGQKAALKMSYTEMSQAIHLLHAHYLDIPMSSWMPSTDLVLPMRSRQFAAGIYSSLPHDIILNVEGYYKTMDNMYEYCGIDSIYPDLSTWEYELFRGKGRSYGAEIELGWKGKDTDISAYYTLSWTERFFEGIWHDWFPARNDNRHKFTVNAAHRFNRRFDMYVAWNYHTGDRMTVPTQMVDGQMFFTSPYNYRLPDYHRLDVGFNFRKTTKRGNESIWNLSVYNAYCRMNPMFASYDLYKDENGEYVNELKVLSAIPIIPSFSYTLRF